MVDGDRSLHNAEWYPACPGDVLTVRYDGGESVLAREETYEVVPDELGMLVLTLRTHSFPEKYAGSAGAYARECLSDDPFFEPWMEAGPAR